MAKQLKLRRGTTSQHGSFTGAEGEVTVDTDKETLVVHDGSTAGGHPVAAEDLANVSSSTIAGRLSNDSIAVSKIAAGTLPSDVKIQDANVSGNLTIESADIVDGTIVNADINASAAIAGTKISPNFGSQNLVTTGNVGIGTGAGTSFPLHVVSNGNNTVLKVESTDADAGVGPIIELFRNSGSPADNDNLGRIDFRADDAANNESTFARIGVVALDVTNATEDARIDFTAVANDQFNPSFSITGAGASVTGNLDVSNGVDVTGGNITLPDAGEVRLGSSGDLQLYHNGSDSYINDTGTGSLRIVTDSLQIRNAANNATRLSVASADGQVNIPNNLDVGAGLDVTGNITVSGNVDGRDVAADGSKLDGIESGATADQTAAEIRTLVESASDSNVFTDADHTKLNGIEASATADQTASEIRTLVESASDSNVFTDADHSKLNGIEASATADQTDAEIRAAVEAASDSNVFTDADHSKLNGIEANATADQTGAEIASALNGQHIRTTAQIGRDSNDHFQFTDNNRLDLYIAGNNEFRFESDGDFHADGDVYAYSTTTASDENLKKDVVTVADAVTKVEALKGVTFKWKKNDVESAGVIAQDVEKVLPQVVKVVADTDGTEFKAVNYGGLTSLLIEAVKDLSARIKVLEAK